MLSITDVFIAWLRISDGANYIRTYLYFCVADNIMYLGAILSCSVREIIYINIGMHKSIHEPFKIMKYF